MDNMTKRLFLKLKKHKGNKKVAMYFAALVSHLQQSGYKKLTDVLTTEKSKELFVEIHNSVNIYRQDGGKGSIYFIGYKGEKKGHYCKDAYEDCVNAGFNKSLGITGEILYNASFADVEEI